MKKSALVLLLLLCSFRILAQQLDPISEYYNRLKISKQKGDAETAFMSTGSEMLYGLEYFEAGSFDYASWRFRDVLKTEPENAYANFLYGVCIARLGKAEEAKPYLEKAVKAMPSLADLANAQLAKMEVKKPKSLFEEGLQKETAAAEKPASAAPAKATPAPAAEKSAGGKLVYGSYACDYMQYQGSNSFGAAYRPVYKGYFVLKADGTYRWLDNGGTGKYSYNASTGKITWLSGPLQSMKPVSSVFKDGQKVASIRISMTESYTWGCGCNK